MLLSMTGYGEARGQTESLTFSIEVRAVNNRHLKLTLRAPEPFNLLESEFERVVRRVVRRGTILIQLRVERVNHPDDFRINAVALKSYLGQIVAACEEFDPNQRLGPAQLIGAVLGLPGVSVESGIASSTNDAEWPVIEKGLAEALARVQQMRADEGQRMVRELRSYAKVISERLSAVRALEPGVVESYRVRLLDRVQSLLASARVAVTEVDLIREVTVYAERSDIAEEIVRLDCHLQQFVEILDGKDDSPGRKLEFVVQEMSRETNTMGAKAGDVGISRLVVEIKTVLEKIREMIQNIE